MSATRLFKNTMMMTTAEKRQTFVQRIEQLDDKFFNAIYAMVEAYVEEEKDPIIGYDPVDGTPKRASRMREELRKEVEAGRRGEYIALEQLREKSDQWLQGTK